MWLLLLFVVGISEGLDFPSAALSRRAVLAGTMVATPAFAVQGDALELYKAAALEKEKKRNAKKVEYGRPKIEEKEKDLGDLSALESKATVEKKKVEKKKVEKKEVEVVGKPRYKEKAPELKSVLNEEKVAPTAQVIVGGDAPIDVTLSVQDRKQMRKQEVLSGEYIKKIREAKK